MNPERKRRMFEAVVRLGIKEIEVGFPAASNPDFEFIRLLIEDDLVPDNVTIQVLTQCRPGAHRAHLRVTKRCPISDRPLLQLDVGLPAPRRLRARHGGRHEDRRRCPLYSAATSSRRFRAPRSATSTAPSLSPVPGSTAQSRSATQSSTRWIPRPDWPLVLNLPSTVEMSTPNAYADLIENFPSQRQPARFDRAQRAQPQQPGNHRRHV